MTPPAAPIAAARPRHAVISCPRLIPSARKVPYPVASRKLSRASSWPTMSSPMTPNTPASSHSATACGRIERWVFTDWADSSVASTGLLQAQGLGEFAEAEVDAGIPSGRRLAPLATARALPTVSFTADRSVGIHGFDRATSCCISCPIRTLYTTRCPARAAEGDGRNELANCCTSWHDTRRSTGRTWIVLAGLRAGPAPRHTGSVRAGIRTLRRRGALPVWPARGAHGNAPAVPSRRSASGAGWLAGELPQGECLL